MKRANLFRKAKNAGSINAAAGHQTAAKPLPTLPDVLQKDSTTKKPKAKLNFENLNHNLQQLKNNEETKTAIDEPEKKKSRVKVDLEKMREELKQLEDPPATSLEKTLSVNRLNYEFYNTPCEELAQNLLGKILVRRLENGTILKGRIVETESYLGGIDKGSQTYQYNVTPRNIPVYMPPGTIHVYLTYGMYCCFNISSEESHHWVLIRTVEALVEALDYIELLMNTEKKLNMRETQMANVVKPIKPHKLCNDPSKICTAFVIEQESFDGKNLVNSDSLWIENDVDKSAIFIVAAPRIDDPYPINQSVQRLLRFYVLGNPCVANRNLHYEDRAYTLQRRIWSSPEGNRTY